MANLSWATIANGDSFEYKEIQNNITPCDSHGCCSVLLSLANQSQKLNKMMIVEADRPIYDSDSWRTHSPLSHTLEFFLHAHRKHCIFKTRFSLRHPISRPYVSFYLFVTFMVIHWKLSFWVINFLGEVPKYREKRRNLIFLDYVWMLWIASVGCTMAVTVNVHWFIWVHSVWLSTHAFTF